MIEVPASLRVEPGVFHRIKNSDEVLTRAMVTGEPMPTMCGKFVTTGNASRVTGDGGGPLPHCVPCEDMIAYLVARIEANAPVDVLI